MSSKASVDAHQDNAMSVERLEDINKKLMGELNQMIIKLESAINKFLDRKEQDRISFANHGYYGNVSEDLKVKEKELKSAQQRAINVKKEILRIKRQLETAIDIDTITAMENDIKNKEMVLQKLEDQNESMKKVGKNQLKAMADLNKEEEIGERLRNLNENIRVTKQEIREKQ